MEPGGITVTVELAMTPQAAEGFSQMGSAGLEATRNFPGFREVQILRDKDDPCRFIFIERWESEQAYNDYVAFRTERGEYQSLQKMATTLQTRIWPHVIAAA